MNHLILFLSSFLLACNCTYAQPKTVAVEDLAAEYDSFLLDAYGVFWGSREVGVLPGAAAAMEYLVSHGKEVGILSNSTQLAEKEKEKLKKHGLYEGVHYHFLLTSGEFARELLLEGELPFPTPRNTFWMFGSPHPVFGSNAHIYEGTKYRETMNLDEADFIHILVPHIQGADQEDPEVFRKWVEAAGTGVPVLCVNPDRFGPEGSPPRPVVRQGWIAQMFKEQGASVHLVGKPSKMIFEAALKRFPSGISREKVIMIGDTPETDIRGAHGVGIAAALVTQTGVKAPLIESEGVEAVIDQLPSDDKPDYLLDRFKLEHF